VAILKSAVVRVVRSLRDQTDEQDALLTSKIILFTPARHGRSTAGGPRCNAACMDKQSASDPGALTRSRAVYAHGIKPGSAAAQRIGESQNPNAPAVKREAGEDWSG
jgi:hypothetical protein